MEDSDRTGVGSVAFEEFVGCGGGGLDQAVQGHTVFSGKVGDQLLESVERDSECSGDIRGDVARNSLEGAVVGGALELGVLPGGAGPEGEGSGGGDGASSTAFAPGTPGGVVGDLAGPPRGVAVACRGVV